MSSDEGTVEYEAPEIVEVEELIGLLTGTISGHFSVSND